MNKDITSELLKKFAENYEKNHLAKVVRHALQHSDIPQLAGIQESGSDLKNRFSIDIATLPVTNQKNSGRCWIFSGLNVLREKVAKSLNLENFEFSQNYTAFYDKLEKANFYLETVIELKEKPFDDRTLSFINQLAIQDGGQWDMLTANIEKYGLVPKDVMPETYASSHTHYLNTLLNRRLRKFAVDIRRLTQEIEIIQAKENALADVYGMLCSSFGIPPQSFAFEYVDKDNNYHIEKNLTPHSFYKKYVDIHFEDYVSLIDSPRQETPYYDHFTVKYLGSVIGKPVHYINVPMSVIKEAVIKQLKDGQVVWFGSDCSKFSDRKNGYWAPESFDFESLFGVDFDIDKTSSLYAAESAMNHAMVITGVNVNEEGKSTKWKIENSWGDEIANKGYFVGSDEWFDCYVYQVVVHKKYLDQQVLYALEKPTKELEPWDPMGALAK